MKIGTINSAHTNSVSSNLLLHLHIIFIKGRHAYIQLCVNISGGDCLKECGRRAHLLQNVFQSRNTYRDCSDKNSDIHLLFCNVS